METASPPGSQDLPRLPGLSSLLSFGGGSAGGNDGIPYTSTDSIEDEPRSLPSLRSLNILPFTPLERLSNGPGQALSEHDDQEHLTDFRSHAHGPVWGARPSTNLTNDRPRPSSSTSACSSSTSLTTSSSYSNKTVSSENHHGHLAPIDPRHWSYGSTSGERHQGRPSTSSSSLLKDNVHPFSYSSSRDQIRQQPLSLRLDSLALLSPHLPDPSATPIASQSYVQEPESLPRPPPSRSITPQYSSSLPRSFSSSRTTYQASPETADSDTIADVPDEQHSFRSSSHYSRSVPADLPGTRVAYNAYGRSYSSPQDPPFPLRHSQSLSYELQPSYHPYFPFHPVQQQPTATSQSFNVPLQSRPSRLSESNGLQFGSERHQSYPALQHGYATPGGPFSSATQNMRSKRDNTNKTVSRRKTFGSLTGSTSYQSLPGELQQDLGRPIKRQAEEMKPTSSSEGNRPYACPGCDRSFARRYDRNRHARKHTGEKVSGRQRAPP